ncbi:hypothetical protein I553_2511 [Mycobacterium xenopi 4042]|uniref:RES domain protein n=1 Tax=Mycobacterium xenopi 4042 TaxID=1299334 RepID=X8CAI2_MYCXE|nr:hypothetical protein I553_2511 [Mycobacterium xenopi 4042]
MSAGTELWRVDATAPAEWTWQGFPEALFRFDPESGSFRTRYAAASLVGAFRERYRPTGLVIPADHAAHHVVRLVAVRHLRVLDLRTEANLDALSVDDQISTGQHPEVWDTCHRLADAVKRWWSDLDAIVYRPRTTPRRRPTSRSLPSMRSARSRGRLPSGRRAHRTCVAARLYGQLGRGRRVAAHARQDGQDGKASTADRTQYPETSAIQRQYRGR